ncbi:MAG: 4-alpha-glucanotransferase [Chlamydiia bacterium]|nr:4-alpha-glucanotransferase [Chlamydiia bacterium]
MKTGAHWQKVGMRPHHGLCVPLFALRTQASCGIGEFLDLLPLIQWCPTVGFDCLQLLPLNDTGRDPSPYNPQSSCALDPVYLSLKALTAHRIQESSSLPDPLSLFSRFNELPHVARNEVKSLKLQWLSLYFDSEFPRISQTPAYRRFLSENSAWLEPYVQFRALKESQGESFWPTWPNTSMPSQHSMDFHRLVQFLCFSQMQAVRDYASMQAIFLLGDMPILLSPDSADVWSQPYLFVLDRAAGAPPDFYNPLGQKWGFPPFHWDAMRKTQFAWFKQRLRMIDAFYHLYRIDHVVGLFRIWIIPPDLPASEGSFSPSDPSLWVSQGREMLEMMIDSCLALPIAEDLGVIPREVPILLKELGICGTKVIRWQKEAGIYIPYAQYEPLSMTTVSTADSESLSSWWQQYPGEATTFAQFNNWDYHPTLSLAQHYEILKKAHHTPSYFHINLLQEYLTHFPDLAWPDPMQDRINVPGTLLPTNWTYRFRLSLEELTSHQGLAEMIRSLLLFSPP